MVIVWVLTMPHAAARFEHEILLPRFAHLPTGGIFFVASAAALMELTAAALLARTFAAMMRKAGRRVIHRYQHHRGTSGFAQRYAGLLVCFGWPGDRTLDRAEIGKSPLAPPTRASFAALH
jgi:hypothetical protein